MSHTDPPPLKAAAEHGPHAHSAAVDPDAGHETDDVNIRALVTFGVGMFAVAVVIHALMWGLFQILQSQAAKNDPPQSPLARPAVQMPTNTIGTPVFGQGEGVQLLSNEPTVLGQTRESETAALTTYGWVDQKTGVARIPIAAAKKLLVERGVPSRGEAADPMLGTKRGAYGESSGGRILTAKPPADGAQQEAPKQESAPGPPAHEKGSGQ